MVDVLTGETGKKEKEKEKPLNILLVEDDVAPAGLIKLVLKDHNITVYDNAEQALGKLRDGKRLGITFDWVITDKGLADGKGGIDEEGGFKVAEAIKEEQLGNPFVTLFTGIAIDVKAKHTESQLKEKGIHQVLAKPVKIQDFINAAQSAREFGRDLKFLK